MKDGRGVFLIDFSDAKKTAFYLEIIKGTHAGLTLSRSDGRKLSR